MSCTDDSDPNCILYPPIVVTLQQYLIQTAMQSIVYGCFVVVASHAVFHLVRHGFPSSASRRCLLLAALLLFIITTISYSLDLTIQVANIALGPAEPDLTALALMERIYAPDVIFERINYILTDAIVVWRAWVVSETVVLRIILVVCLLGTTACSFVNAAFEVKAGLFTFAATPIEIMITIALLVTNVVATLIILYKTWVYRSEIKVHIQNDFTKSRTTPVEQVFFLLLESGVVYITLWLITSLPLIFVMLLRAIPTPLAGIYPLLVLLIIEHQKSVNRIDHDGVSESIRFASAHREQDPRSADTMISVVETIKIRMQKEFGDLESGLETSNESTKDVTS